MSIKFTSIVAAISMSALMMGCEKPFTPNSTYADKMVVYGILTNRSDSQFVRIYTTYDPAGFNPLEHSEDVMVRGAEVTVTGASQPFQFREGLVRRIDKSRYKDDIVTYTSHPFLLQAGTSYKLNVSSPRYGTVTSSVVVPKRGRVQFLNAYVLRGGGDKDENVVVYGWIRELTYGVIARLYIVYEVLEGQAWVRHAEEVPLSMAESGDGTSILKYPSLRRRVTNAIVVDKEVNETFVFLRKVYFNTEGSIYARHPAGTVRVTHALAVLTQVDQNLYTYVKLANYFDDPYSMRTDAPDFTNIEGGRGVFGAMVEDSMWVDLSVR